jgi:hypothetical protein
VSPALADVKADYAARAERVAAAFVHGNDWQRIRALWNLATHHGLAATWPVLRDESLRALGFGPNLPWRYPNPRRRNNR